MERGGAVVWLGGDLRLRDNTALHEAVERHREVTPVFVWAPEEEGRWAPGAASRWWLHQSLEALAADLETRGSRLVVRRGPVAEALAAVAKESGASHVFYNRRYEPAWRRREEELERTLAKGGLQVTGCAGNLLFEPGSVLNQSGKPFQVFTPFWRSCLQREASREPVRAPARIPGAKREVRSLRLAELELEPKVDWAGGLRETWRPGEAGAQEQFRRFVRGSIEAYGEGRDRPAERGTSRLSPHLHFGEISARQIWHEVRNGVEGAAADTFLRQIGWREFSHHVLFHFPHTDREPLRPEFRNFPWRVDGRGLEAWTQGRTGYPLVDAGMRELWHTGWMHNRVRMLAASFLVKHLLIPWQEGAAWFWDTLVDADLANNTMGWQWSAGCGADAAPYFRIFNPVLQGKKFDPEGEYVKRWVPEIAAVPKRWIHEPWEAGAEMPKGYPKPVVAHEAARKRALEALAKLRR